MPPDVTMTPEAREQIVAEGRQAESKRRNEISAMARNAGRRLGEETVRDLERQFLENGKSADDFGRALFDQMGSAPPPVAPHPGSVNLEMGASEQKAYSVSRAISVACGFEKGGLEAEVSETIAAHFGRAAQGNSIFVPTAIDMSMKLTKDQRQAIRAANVDRTTMVVGTAGVGGNAVQTTLGPLVELIRNRMMTRRMGAQVLSGLTGPLAFPRQATASTLYWTGENPGSDVTQSNATLEQPSLTPKSAQGTNTVSRQLLRESSFDCEMFIRNDLAKINALGLDYAGIAGNPDVVAAQPRGICYTTGIGGSAVGGTNGAAPTYANLITIWRDVAIDSADFGKLGFLINGQTAGKLMLVPRLASTDSRMAIEKFPDADGMTDINGMRCGVSNQVPSTLVKGGSGAVCSAIVFGNWDDLVYGEFGAMELITDPYTMAKQGLVEVTSFMMCDVMIRHPQSFAAMLDALSA